MSGGSPERKIDGADGECLVVVGTDGRHYAYVLASQRFVPVTPDTHHVLFTPEDGERTTVPHEQGGADWRDSAEPVNG